MPAGFWILEAASRSALMAVAVWTSIRLLRIRAAQAQKLAWAMVLVAAGIMPLAMRSPWFTNGLAGLHPVKIPLHPGAVAAPQPVRTADALQVVQLAAIASAPKPSPAHHLDEDDFSPSVSAAVDEPISEAPAPSVATRAVADPATSHVQPTSFWTWSRARSIGLSLYFGIAAILLLRMVFGLAIALRLWSRARPSAFPGIRVSRDLSTPVTIASTVILPSDYADWDAAKLRIVLAHEQAHIRQRDFYLQVLAALHAAAFWFSPLGWWLQRKLSELGEALSDRAGLAESPSPAAYAQILLEFAARPRTSILPGYFTGPLTGVPMARSSNLSGRIERILSSSRSQFAALTNRRHAVLAAAMVPVALVAVVACIRIVPTVEAAQQTQAPTPSPAPAPTQATPGQVAPSAPDQVISVDAPQTATPAPEPNPAPAPQPPALPSAPPQPPTPPQAPTSVSYSSSMDHSSSASSTSTSTFSSSKGNGSSTSFAYSNDKDGQTSFAIVSGKGDSTVNLSGRSGRALDEAKRKYHGAFIWFERDGKSWVITDPAIVAQARSFFQANQPLQIRQAALERMQAKLDAEMANLKPEIDQAKLPGPEFDAQMAKLQQEIGNMHLEKLPSDLSIQFSAAQQAEFNKQMAELSSQTAKARLAGPECQAQIGKLQQQLSLLQRNETRQLSEQIAKQARESRELSERLARQASKLQAESASDALISSAEKLQERAEQRSEELQSRLGDINEHFGDIQGRLGEIQGEIGERMGRIGERQGEIGERMGELGEQMGKIGEQQGKIAEDASRKVQSLIDQAFKDGKAAPLQ